VPFQCLWNFYQQLKTMTSWSSQWYVHVLISVQFIFNLFIFKLSTTIIAVISIRCFFLLSIDWLDEKPLILFNIREKFTNIWKQHSSIVKSRVLPHLSLRQIS
jgi:hypothetical protein